MILPEIPLWQTGVALPNGDEPKAVATRLAALDAVKGALRSGRIVDVRLETRGEVLFIGWRHTTPGQAVASQVRAECVARDQTP